MEMISAKTNGFGTGVESEYEIFDRNSPWNRRRSPDDRGLGNTIPNG